MKALLVAACLCLAIITIGIGRRCPNGGFYYDSSKPGKADIVRGCFEKGDRRFASLI